MIQARQSCRCILMLIALLPLSACKGKEPASKPQELPDLNAQIHSYVTLENTKLRTGPGTQFRTIAEIRQNSKVQVVVKDGVTERQIPSRLEAAKASVTVPPCGPRWLPWLRRLTPKRAPHRYRPSTLSFPALYPC